MGFKVLRPQTTVEHTYSPVAETRSTTSTVDLLCSQELNRARNLTGLLTSFSKIMIAAKSGSLVALQGS